MRTIARICLLVFLILSVAGFLIGQTQTVRIVVKGVSPDLMAQGRYDAVSSGLPNVGKGQKVWLQAVPLYGTGQGDNYIDTILTADWSITNPPGGAAAIVETDTTTYFIPDTTGTYKIDLSITTANGSASASIYVNSAYWVGTGSFAGSPDISKGQCAAGCHSDKITTWSATPHAHIFSFNIDSSTHYTESCLSCHTVGYDTSPTAVNGGWDDVAAGYGFTLPSPHPGAWDSIKTNFPDLANVSNIQCENCHGPGSAHLGDTSKSKMVATLSAEMCGQCHGKAMHHIKSYEWNNSVHSKSMAEGEVIEAMNRTSCARCHTANGYVNETVNGNASTAPYADVQPVACAACHDPHDASKPHQLRSASTAAACDGCHITRISSRGLHHSHQSPMLTGSKGTPFTGQSGIGNWGGWQFPGYAYPNSSHSNITDRCATCHMAESAGGDDTLMVPAPFSKWEGQLGGHTFRVFWDAGTPDDTTDDLINPFGCKDCHGSVSLNFVKQTQAKTKALLEQLRVLLPHATSGDTTLPLPHTNASLSPIQKAAAYNWYFVDNDGSFGVHNYMYTAALLQSSIDMVKLGAGAASIASITDVPNDQGKEVQIVWNKFPAESYPTDPVINYLVLRQDSGASSVAKIGGTIVTASSYREMLSKVSAGKSVILAGAVWTKVGEFKAIKQPQYSLIVPTLFDSTITGGLKQATFEVVGYTAANVVYASAPMSGYSVDNLAPVTPSGLAAHSGGGIVVLNWATPKDNDFQYFAIYRGTTPGFTPSADPLATTTTPTYTDQNVVNGNTYYYKVGAYDFSGNESLLSIEVSLMVTSVGDMAGVPTEFALLQNSPNPFNPSTSIRYQVPGAAHVKISVYNTLGMLVATLVDQSQAAGYYKVVWNGKDLTGNIVATGIYLYRMDAGSYSSVRKMMFIK